MSKSNRNWVALLIEGGKITYTEVFLFYILCLKTIKIIIRFALYENRR